MGILHYFGIILISASLNFVEKYPAERTALKMSLSRWMAEAGRCNIMDLLIPELLGQVLPLNLMASLTSSLEIRHERGMSPSSLAGTVV